MAYNDIENWDDLYKKFIFDLSEYGLSLEGALRNFVERYEELKEQEECEEKKEESLEFYFDRKMKPVWDYVYSLQRQITNQNAQLNEIKTQQRLYDSGIQQRRLDLGAGGPAVGVPYYGAGGGNIPLTTTVGLHTTGYMKIDEPEYSEQQIQEWSNVRFDTPIVTNKSE